MTVVARFAIQEALRRRVFAVVAVLTALFLVLYGLGAWQVFQLADEAEEADLDGTVIVGSTIFGLSMFATLFLGAVLAVFLTHAAVRGDAERGLLQPLVVRPISRRDMIVARLLAAGAVSGGYTIAVFLAAMVLTGAIGGWWPDRPLLSGLALSSGVVIVAALSLLGSVVLSSVANGIAVFMAFGAGLTAGLLGQIGRAFGSDSLTTVADIASYALPFEALYQAALSALTADTVGFTRFALELGPFGGAREAGVELALWSVAYLAAVVFLAARLFERRDL